MVASPPTAIMSVLGAHHLCMPVPDLGPVQYFLPHARKEHMRILESRRMELCMVSRRVQILKANASMQNDE